ncbi:hypothetical protein QRX50_36250 [Amycolatopsis carbonis]|uniref:Uncharacterized protein n=1 Tax=Amycolatopsis carbonis TaxID=715471 RepID=A0A9Y2MSN7_9PSEU|nr:hypothetical protein [Amycolatopsis sp. 2-15]WIX76841.1 hypothetical protein QRX50_36250 [Amycolatopsis sp. 2-15]
MPGKLSDDQIEELVAGYRSGSTLFGMDRRTVSNVRCRHHVPTRRRGLSPEQADDAIDSYNLGWSLARVGERVASTTSPLAITVCGLKLLVIRLRGAALSAYARLAHLYASPGDDQDEEGTHRSLLLVVIGYVIAILIGLFVPIAAVALYFGIVVYLIVSLHQIARAVFRR